MYDNNIKSNLRIHSQKDVDDPWNFPSIAQLASPNESEDASEDESPIGSISKGRRHFSIFQKQSIKKYSSRSTIFEPETNLSPQKIQSLFERTDRRSRRDAPSSTELTPKFQIARPGVFISQLPPGQVWRDANTGEIVDVTEHNRRVDESGEARYNQIRRMNPELEEGQYRELSSSLAQPVLESEIFQNLEDQMSELDLNVGSDLSGSHE